MVCGIQVDWINSYLFHRSQAVHFDGVLSNKEFVTHGVPQGSILGPLLFVFLINDLPTQLKFCNVLMYADDTVIYFTHKSPKEIEHFVNEDANAVFKWMSENCLILNPKKGKTEFLLFASKKREIPVKIVIDENVINQPETYEYLGIKLDSHLNMSSHFQVMFNRISSRIKMLRKVRHKISPLVATTIFKSMIEPLFFYCYPTFGQISNTWLYKFESLFTRAKVIVKFHQQSWPTFRNGMKKRIVTNVFKALNNDPPNGKYELINHGIATRGNSNKIRLPNVATF